MNIKEFVKERNEAMFSLEKEKIVAYCKKYDVPIPENEQVFWAGVYKSILAIENLVIPRFPEIHQNDVEIYVEMDFLCS